MKKEDNTLGLLMVAIALLIGAYMIPVKPINVLFGVAALVVFGKIIFNSISLIK